MPPVNPVPFQPPRKRGSNLLIPLILTILLLIASLGFGFWAFVERGDYKNNSDKKAAAAVAAAEKKQAAKLEAEFAEQEKEPLETYTGPAAYGSVTIKYPKTWSVYVNESGRSATPLDGYMHPLVVPGAEDTAYALHFQVTNTTYDQELKKFETLVKNGSVSSDPINAPKVANVDGVRLTGEVERGKTGVVVLFPLRDKTLKITTESQDYVDDFDAFILPNLVFVP